MDFHHHALRYISRAALHTKAAIWPDLFGVTVVVTSCNRHDLLDMTLASFFAHNRFPISQMIVVEDGEKSNKLMEAKYKSRNIEWISTGKRVGQIAAIDYAYSRVKTSYVFHMEDDWEFYRSGFIAESLSILENHPDCLQVYLRALDDINGHPLEDQVHHENGITWRKLIRNFTNQWGEWHGFSFNPGLRRLNDYVLTGGYGNICSFDFDNPGKAESKIAVFYKNNGYFAAILCSRGGEGFVRHTGTNRHVKPRGSLRGRID